LGKTLAPAYGSRTDADHLDRRVPQLVAVQKGLVGGGKRRAVGGDRVEDDLLDVTHPRSTDATVSPSP
jgi:hypothetical protein